MKRFKIIYLVGESKREAIIESENLDNATIKADELRPTWQDIIELNPNIQNI